MLLSDSGNGDLVVLDAASQKEIKRLKVGENYEGILVAPDGSRAYVASEKSNFVGMIDLKKLEMTSRIQPGNGRAGLGRAEITNTREPVLLHRVRQIPLRRRSELAMRGVSTLVDGLSDRLNTSASGPALTVSVNPLSLSPTTYTANITIIESTSEAM